MRILLTNDDGINSPGLTMLAKALREDGHRVFVTAPGCNRSGSSHSILFLNEPCKLEEVDKDTWICSGTPVDCVLVSLLGAIDDIRVLREGTKINIENAPDLILSGINKGANLGTDIVYSGTAGAARQGSFFGIPSVALSLVENGGVWYWETAIQYITENLSDIMGFWKERCFVNVNFPNIGKKPAALVPSFPSVRYYNDSIVKFNAPEGGIYCFAKAGKTTAHTESGRAEDGSDWAEVLKGNAALSVVMSQPVSVSAQG